MIYDLLKEDSLCGGNIGTPLAKISNIYNNKKDKYKQIILETSSFTLHYTNKVKPDIYILLPISDDHVSWHGSFKEYEKAKLKPLSMMPKNSVAVVPSIYKDIKTDALTYYYKDSSDLAGQFNIDTEKIKFNEPFLLDSLLALCVKKILTDEIDYETINEFVVDKHKVEEFRDSQNRLWVDDSKATNLDATVWALKGYKDKQINLILGGDDKGAELDPLFKEMKNYDIELFTIGSNSQKLGDLAQKYDILCNCFTNLKEAVDAIDKKMKTQNPLNTSVSMLSPAAASLDQFESYKQRGEEFKNFVNSLEN
jgi:UDP-N-acetylmuramoylalanine--D-glutamate ligase